MITIMTTSTSVTHVTKVNICNVKVTRDDKISRYCPDIAHISNMVFGFTQWQTILILQ
jgi:hypothetical protein